MVSISMFQTHYVRREILENVVEITRVREQNEKRTNVNNLATFNISKTFIVLEDRKGHTWKMMMLLSYFLFVLSTNFKSTLQSLFLSC